MSSTCLGHLPLQLIYVLGRTRFVVFNYWYLKQLALTHTYCVVFGSPSYKEYSFTQTTEGKSHNKALFSLWLCSSLAEAWQQENGEIFVLRSRSLSNRLWQMPIPLNSLRRCDILSTTKTHYGPSVKAIDQHQKACKLYKNQVKNTDISFNCFATPVK